MLAYVIIGRRLRFEFWSPATTKKKNKERKKKKEKKTQ